MRYSRENIGVLPKVDLLNTVALNKFSLLIMPFKNHA